MQLPQVDYYAIQDISDAGRQKTPYSVVAEYDNRREAEARRDKLKVVGCEVYADVGGKLYRVICKQLSMRSGE